MAEAKPETKPQKELKHLMRVLNTDLKGDKQLMYALCKIKGISVMFSNAVCHKAGIAHDLKAGYLTEQQVATLEKIITRPLAHGIPTWLINRRKDFETGEDMHLITSTLDFTSEMDVKRLKKTKSYKGLRHQWGQPVRGQKTRSNFRKNKGKGSLGVQRKKAAAPAKDKK